MGPGKARGRVGMMVAGMQGRKIPRCKTLGQLIKSRGSRGGRSLGLFLPFLLHSISLTQAGCEARAGMKDLMV